MHMEFWKRSLGMCARSTHFTYLAFLAHVSHTHPIIGFLKNFFTLYKNSRALVLISNDLSAHQKDGQISQTLTLNYLPQKFHTKTFPFHLFGACKSIWDFNEHRHLKLDSIVLSLKCSHIRRFFKTPQTF